jgi:hypothetical protein
LAGADFGRHDTLSVETSRPPNLGRTRAATTTWTLWIGALLVVSGAAAQLKHQAVAARALWVLAVLAFVATAVGR